MTKHIAYLLVRIDPDTRQVTDAMMAPYPEVQGPWAMLTSSRPARHADLAKDSLWITVREDYPWVLPLLEPKP
jgi:hypothetical protein